MTADELLGYYVDRNPRVSVVESRPGQFDVVLRIDGAYASKAMADDMAQNFWADHVAAVVAEARSSQREQAASR